MTNDSGGRKALDAAKRMLKEKGYYIVLFLCIAAVGISGYVFIRTAISAHKGGVTLAPDAGAQSTLDVPLTARDDDDRASASASSSTADTDTADAAVTTMTDAEVGQIAADTVIRPVAGETIAAYSMDALAYNETLRDWRVHCGVDIAAQPGAQVLAAKAGTVSAVYDDEFYGTTVELTHAGGYRTVYSNLTPTALVDVGSSVAAGAVLGAVGDTAVAECASAPHLHFAVLLGSEYVDPEAFLS